MNESVIKNDEMKDYCLNVPPIVEPDLKIVRQDKYGNCSGWRRGSEIRQKRRLNICIL